LSKNIQNQSDISSNSNYFIQGDINNLLSHINDLNEKIIYYNTLANIKDKENQKLIEENKILRTNLEIIKRRFNLK
jgi:regulator of replication initiation timing